MMRAASLRFTPPRSRAIAVRTDRARAGAWGRKYMNETPSAADRSLLELQVLAQIRDSLTTLNTDVREVREKVIRLEERDQRVSSLEQTIAKLDTRVDVLLKDKDRRDGAVSMGQAVVKHLPSLSLGAILTALAAWFSKAIH